MNGLFEFTDCLFIPSSLLSFASKSLDLASLRLEISRFVHPPSFTTVFIRPPSIPFSLPPFYTRLPSFSSSLHHVTIFRRLPFTIWRTERERKSVARWPFSFVKTTNVRSVTHAVATRIYKRALNGLEYAILKRVRRYV